MAPQQAQPVYQPQTQGFTMNPMGAAQPQVQQPMMYANTNMPNAMNPTGAVQQPVAQPQAQPVAAPAPTADGPAQVKTAFKK